MVQRIVSNWDRKDEVMRDEKWRGSLTERAGVRSLSRREVPKACAGTAISRSVVETGNAEECGQSSAVRCEGGATCLSGDRCTAGGRKRIRAFRMRRVENELEVENNTQFRLSLNQKKSESLRAQEE